MFFLASAKRSRVSVGRVRKFEFCDETAGWKRSPRSAKVSCAGGAGGRIWINRFEGIKHVVVGRLGIARKVS